MSSNTPLTLEAFKAKTVEVLNNIDNILRNSPNQILALNLLGGELSKVYKCKFKAIGVAKGCKGKLKGFLEHYLKEPRWSHIRLHQVTGGDHYVSLHSPVVIEGKHNVQKHSQSAYQNKLDAKNENQVEHGQLSNPIDVAVTSKLVDKTKSNYVIDVDDRIDIRESEDMDLETSNSDSMCSSNSPRRARKRNRKRSRKVFKDEPEDGEIVELLSSGEDDCSSNVNSNSENNIAESKSTEIKTQIIQKNSIKVTSLNGSISENEREPIVQNNPGNGLGIESDPEPSIVDANKDDPTSGTTCVTGSYPSIDLIAKQESEVETLRRRLQEKEAKLQRMKKKARQDELMKLLTEKQLRLKIELLKKKVQSVKASASKKKGEGPSTTTIANAGQLKPLRIFSQTFRVEIDLGEMTKQQNAEKKFSRNNVENEIAVLKQKIASEEKRRKENTMSSTLVQMKAVKLAEIDVRTLEIKIQNQVKQLNDTSAKIMRHMYENHNKNKVITKRKSAADFFL